MPTDCIPALFEFPPIEGRHVVASFDGGAITSDAGAVLLGQADRAIRLTELFAACFSDTRSAELVEHQVETMVMQRVIGIALGYEDLNDHEDLRHDPVLAVLARKLAAQRSDCAPLAGKSTLNRLELSRAEATRYHKVSHDPAAIETLFVDLFLDAHKKAPKQIILDLDATDDPLHGDQEGRFFHGYYDCYNRQWKQDDQLQKEVSYFDVSTWTRLAEVCGEYLKKGRGVRVVGRLKQDRWTDPEGKAHSRVEIVAEHVEFKPQKKAEGDLATDAAEGKPAESAEQEQEEDKEAAGF